MVVEQPSQGTVWCSVLDLRRFAISPQTVFSLLVPFSTWYLARYWVSEVFVIPQGDSLLEDLAEEYYDELVGRSLLHDFL